jgi:hypothetical protein
MRFIYRVENDDGNGPYRNINEDVFPSSVYYGRHANLRHPTPYRDSLLKRLDRDECCGFISVEQFRKWFNKEDRKRLVKHNFHITLYRANSYRLGEYQAVFKKSSSDLVKTISINI